MCEIKFAVAFGAWCVLIQTSLCRPANLKSADDAVRVELRPLENDFWSLIFDSIIKAELFAQSAGSHVMATFIAANADVDADNHAIAASVAKLWSDLRTMEPSRRVYADVMRNVTDSKEIGLNQLMATYMSMLGNAYERDPVVGRRYVALKAEMKGKIILPKDHVAKEKSLSQHDRDEKNLNNLSIKRLSLNEGFIAALIENVEDSETKYRHITRSILDFAKNDDQMYNKLQKIYDQALTEAATPLILTEYPITNIHAPLFTILERNIASDSQILAAFESKLKKVNKPTSKTR